MDLKKLSEPLSVDDLDFRVQSITSKGYATILVYKNARVDMNRLDDVIGSLNWKREHTRDNMNCIVSIWDESKKQWVSKEDTGTESNTEKEKGLASDSFKRACFNWGIGRELYSYPRININLNTKEFTPDGTKGKPTFEFKIKDWKWITEFKDNKILSLIACDQHGAERFNWSEKGGYKAIFNKKEATTTPPHKTPVKPELKENSEEYKKAIDYLKGGGTIDKIELKYSISDKTREQLISEAL